MVTMNRITTGTLMEAMRFDARAYLMSRPEPIQFYDYPSMMIPEQRKPLVNADQLIGWERK
jgi:hypothetical protein